MARVTHPEIKRLILENHPTAKVILLNEIGSAGPYPGPGVRSQAKDEFQRRLKEIGVDAVISGNGGYGLCTPKETGSSIAAEYVGVPAVTVAAPTFVNQVYAAALAHGVPVPRSATYPGAFAAHTPEELVRNTREVVWPQILALAVANDAQFATFGTRIPAGAISGGKAALECISVGSPASNCVMAARRAS